MSSIDERIVQMKFDNAQFEKGVRGTIDSLGQLTDRIESVASGGMLGKAASGFSAFGSIAFSALQRLTNSAIDMGMKISGAVLDPLVEGGKKRALNIEQAKFQFQGLGMDVEQSMEDALYAVQGTAFGLDEAAVAASQFGASGIESGTEMQNALRGISGVAAMAGSSYTDIANVFTKVAGQGRVMGDDLNRLGSRGINAAATLGEAMGKTETEIRDMVSKGQISFQDFAEAMSDAFGEHATKANETYTGSLSNMRAAISRIGAEFATVDFENKRKMFNALTPAIDNVAKALEPLVKGFTEFSGKATEGVVNFLDALNFSEVDDELPPIFKALENVMTFLMDLARPLRDAFTEIFPAASAGQIQSIAKSIEEMTSKLSVSSETADKIKRTFKGFFAVLGIGWEIVKAGIGFLFDLFGVLQNGSGGFLDVTASIGDFLVAIHDAMKEGEWAAKVFGILGGVIQTIMGVVGFAVGVLVNFAKALANLFTGGGFEFNLDFNPLSSMIEKLIGRFEGLGGAISWVIGVARNAASIFKQVWNILAKGDFVSGVFDEDSKIVDWLFKVRDVLVSVGEAIKDFFSGFDFNTLLDVINTGLFAGLLYLFNNFFGDIKGALGGEGTGILSSITSIFDGLTGQLQAMQNSLKANTLLKIAGAIAVLAAAVLVLSLIDSGDLSRALGAISVMFVELFASMALFEKAVTGPGFAKMPVVAASMILLAVALNILALAVKQMSSLSWAELAKGLTGVAGALLLLAGWAKLMEKQSGPLIRSAAAMILVGVAVKILASAVKDFSGFSWEELLIGLSGLGGVLLAVAGFGKLGGGSTIKGALSMVLIGAALHVLMGPLEQLGGMDTSTLIMSLVGLAGALVVMAGGLSIMSGSIAGAASLVVASAALWILVPLLVELGNMDWNGIGKAATMLAGSLLIIAGGMYLMTGIIAGAASMLVAVAALWVLVPLLVEMGNMSWEEIGKAATMLAGALVIIAGGLYLMTGALPGAAALIVVAAALRVLTPVLEALSQLTWGELLVGLAGLAGAFLVVGVAGLALSPVIPSLFLLGAAILVLGAGAALAGAGMLAFSLGFTALAASAAINGVVIIQLVKDLIGLIPYAAEQIGLGIVAVAQVIINAQSVWVDAMVTVLQSLLEAIRTIAPDIVGTLVELVMLLADVLVDNVPLLVQKGLELLLGILKGIRDNIQQIVEVGLQIIENFIKGVERGLPSLVNSAYNAMITFIDELASTIENNQARMEAASRRLAEAIINALIGGIASFIGGVRSAWRDKVGNAISDAKAAVVNRAKTLASNIISGLRERIVDRATSIASGIRSTVGTAITSARDFVTGRAKSLAGNIISGLRTGISNGASKIKDAAKNVAKSALDGAKNFLGINSPSKEFIKIGKWSVDGMVSGLQQKSSEAEKESASVGSRVLGGFKDAMAGISDDLMTGDPVIRPILDLSEVRKGSAAISGLMRNPSLNATSTYGLASGIATMSESRSDISDETSGGVTFIQNNHSPKAISPVDVYRRTKNQISAARGALSQNANFHSASGRG